MVGLKEGNERLTADPIFFFQEEDQLMVNLVFILNLQHNHDHDLNRLRSCAVG